MIHSSCFWKHETHWQTDNHLWSGRLLMCVLGFAGTNQGCDGECEGGLSMGRQWAGNGQSTGNQWAMLLYQSALQLLPWAKLHVVA